MPTDWTRFAAECAGISAFIGALLGYGIRLIEVRMTARRATAETAATEQKTAIDGYASLCKALGDRLLLVENQLKEARTRIDALEAERDKLRDEVATLRHQLEANV